MQSDNAKASVAASQAILDRGHGKPVQSIEGTGENGEFVFRMNVNYVGADNGKPKPSG
jgi:hypothetical protein